jgi:hypothetical protein
VNFIVDDIGAVVNAMRPIDESYGSDMLTYMGSVHPNTDLSLAPFYMYGHRLEIANRLTLKDKDSVFKYQKYPLIALRLPVMEDVSDGVWHFTLNIAILTFTQKNYNSEQRYQNVFKPVLYPLYKRFLSEIRNSGLFMWPQDQEYPEHEKVDRLYWGTEYSEGHEKNIFNDPIDAIEIMGLKLNQVVKC